ncbi:MAG: sulfite exporter TauE/SafE family protein [Theionarchaea archaeon]|nr:sulfite exporter TauE/SafE family protein [Theionarchaea archaeon]MBU7038028.1 sulfite exporter TauE/SafE family protein [Theionarchaea archaeon]
MFDWTQATNQIPIATAFFLGLVTAVSPCALAANVSGAAFISRTMVLPKYAVVVGTLISLGRIITFLIIGGLMISAGHTIGKIALFSQTAGSLLLGCMLILFGALFLNVISINRGFGGGILARLMFKTHTMGLVGALVLGLLLGLAFCPYSAALFFGMLIPLAVQVSEGYSLPLFFGLGVNVPILVYTGLLYFGATRARTALQRLSHLWREVSSVLGVVLISVGISYIVPCVSSDPTLIRWLPLVVGIIGVGLVIARELAERRSKNSGEIS